MSAIALLKHGVKMKIVCNVISQRLDKTTKTFKSIHCKRHTEETAVLFLTYICACITNTNGIYQYKYCNYQGIVKLKKQNTLQDIIWKYL